MFNIFKKKKEEEFVAPLTGEVLDLTEVPDQVFANKVVGDGVAIKPTKGELVAPVAGVVKQIFATKHAVGIETENNLEVLIHIGVNTVELDGAGFSQVVVEGDKVQPGDKLIEFDLDYIEENAKSSITPVLITNMDAIEELNRKEHTEVAAGEDKILEIKIK
ncbi:PTS glucose transporter subunit IIA [Natroniella sulfidigena]|uniref:PTS sugar transporter subunit IIA n=1 Tax=Natroniella sulfidigena TaxID=723921 RepID=UPI00200A9534|nr:PTS glucose transporter subunit IIA [Natroniella sulfidigena]MCK8816968.1 PTS glucose transporter subunit IIA [Natroniella sulfidigena]